MPPITMTSVNLSEEAAKLLDFSQKLDITLLDNIVTMMYTGNGPQVFIELEYKYLLNGWLFYPSNGPGICKNRWNQTFSFVQKMW